MTGKAMNMATSGRKNVAVQGATGSSTGAGRCHGCGAELEPSRGNRARKWCSDQCRKDTCYVRHCADCGKRLNSSDGNGPNAPTRCSQCVGAFTRVWTPETVVAAIQRWADEHGGVPPTATEWRARGKSYHPPTSAVQDVMGWSAAIRAAGFDAFTRGCYGREGEDPAVISEAVRLYRSGLSLEQVGQAQGVSSGAVKHRLEKVGEPRRSSAEGIRLRRAV